MNKTYSCNKIQSSEKPPSKEDKKKKFIRLCALLGALLMIGTFIISLIGYML